MPANAHKTHSLVIVDDSPFDLRINSGIAGHTQLFKQILCFSSAEAALDFLIENLTNPEVYPLLILLDIQMPEMDGFEFMKRYERFPRSFKEKTNVVMLSSTDDLGDMTRVESDKNVVKLLKKPLQIEELRGLLAHLRDL